MVQPQQRPPTDGEGIFPTFFMAGFECSTFVWKDGKRRDYVALTGHDRHLRQDYQRLMELGIGAAREGIRWPLVDKGGRYDWSTVQPVIDAANECQVAVIWDLCHYGFPDDFDPFSEEGPRRFADYCCAAAELVTRQRDRTHFFTPVNEISFFSGAATDMGWMYPFAKGRHAELKQALCRMAIAGVKAIREVDPAARMVHVDPLIYETAPRNRPDLTEEARRDTYEEALEAWDMLYGRLHPELGGAPDVLDIVGVNIYSYSQSQMRDDGSRTVLGPRDPKRKPLNEMLGTVWQRYHLPIIIGETSGFREERPGWLRMVMEESLIALNDGIDLHGVCLFPCVDMPDWQSGEWAKIGIFDITDAETCHRIPCEPYIQELRRWQQILDRPHQIDEGDTPGGFGRARLDEVRQKAHEWEKGLRARQREEHAREQEAA